MVLPAMNEPTALFKWLSSIDYFPVLWFSSPLKTVLQEIINL